MWKEMGEGDFCVGGTREGEKTINILMKGTIWRLQTNLVLKKPTSWTVQEMLRSSHETDTSQAARTRQDKTNCMKEVVGGLKDTSNLP